MAAEVGVNSYVSREEASAYLKHRLDAEAWEQAEEEKQDAALVTATRRIDMQRLRGRKADPSQPLEFPRKYLTGRGWMVEKEPPQAVKDATCEEALALLSLTDYQRSREREHELGMVGRSVGDANEYAQQSVVQWKAMGGRRLLSPEARRLLAPYLAGAVSIA